MLRPRRIPARDVRALAGAPRRDRRYHAADGLRSALSPALVVAGAVSGCLHEGDCAVAADSWLHHVPRYVADIAESSR